MSESEITESLAEKFNDENSFVIKLEDGVHEVSASQLNENKYLLDLTPFLPNNKALTLQRFFELVGQLISTEQEKEGIVENLRVKVSEEYPPRDYADLGPSGELITYKLQRREPGGNDKTGKELVQHRGRYYYNLTKADDPNRVITVNSRPVNHQIEFSCWSKTNKQANSRLIWLEKLLIRRTDFFKVNGAQWFVWLRSGSEVTLTAGQQKLTQRTLVFELRFQEFEPTSSPALQNVDFEIKLW